MSDYGISENPFHWGPVNNELDFSGYGNVINGNGGYFAYGSPEDSREASNDPSVSKTSYTIKDRSTYFEAVRTSATVANADGQNGRSNGIIAYNEDSNSISGSTEGFLSSELVDYNVRDYLDASDVKSKISCPEDRCLASVDITTEDSGWSHFGTGGFSPSVYSASIDSTVSVTESAGACETYKNLTGVSDEELDCSPGPNFDVCGEYAWEQKVYKEGDDVDETVLSNHEAHEEACMDTRNQESYCVLGNSTKGTELVEEGTVANIAPFHHDNDTYHTNDYQEGGNSPDRSVCLDRDSSTIQGEWYNLDDPGINSYLRSNEGSSDLDLSTTQRLGNSDHIDYYYGKNPNPQHPEYNPRGGEKGVSLIADCGPLLQGCGNDGSNERGDINDNDDTYFAFFEEEYSGEIVKDEDFHPKGLNTTSYYVNPMFNGTINKVKKSQMGTDGWAEFDAHQLDPGHPDTSEVATEWYNDTTIGSDEAVQYAYTKYRNWSIDVTGVPYPPFNAENLGYSNIDDTGNHYSRTYTGPKRTSLDDKTIPKTAKAFGNSIAVVAGQDIGAYSVEKGEGFWIDPDNVENHSNKGYIKDITPDTEDWRDLSPGASISQVLMKGSLTILSTESLIILILATSMK